MKAALPILILFQLGTLASYAQKIHNLSGGLEIRPDENQIKADITYRYVPTEQNAEEPAQFYLPLALEISSIEGSVVTYYEELVDTTSAIGKIFKTLVIYLDSTVTPQQPADIHMKYGGTMALHDFFEVSLPENWIEISPNAVMLTPITTNLIPTTLDLTVVAPDSFQVIAPGQTTTKAPGETLIFSNIPLTGVAFILSNNLDIEEYPYEESVVKLVSYEAQDSLKQALAHMVGWTVNYYNSTFGKSSLKRDVTVALRPFADADANYAVGDNYFVTYDSQGDFFENKPFHYGNFSHEIAHFWWHKANGATADNWINESLAEVSSLLAVKGFLGEKAFQQKLERHQQRATSIPDSLTLTNYERFGEYDQIMAYSVGTLVWYSIYEQIGELAFFQLLREIDEEKISTTHELIAILDRKFEGGWVNSLKKRIERP